MTWAGLAALLGQAEEYTNDTDWTGADWVLADGDTIGGVHTNVGLFSVPEGVTVSVMTYQSDVPGSGAAAVFADRIRIKGVLSANGAGYPMAEGPGTGGPGAGHGGLGGGSPNATGGGRYGSVREPVTLGSGGSKGGAHAGGAGGGAIRLVASDILEIDGTLSANGIDSPQTKGSGGSGGSLWLSAPTLGGSGLICADGGGCYPVGGAGAGGGGGRIAFAVETNLFLGIVRASGGKSYHERAGHGTLNVMDL